MFLLRNAEIFSSDRDCSVKQDNHWVDGVGFWLYVLYCVAFSSSATKHRTVSSSV